MIYYFSLLYANSLDGKLNPDLEGNLTQHSQKGFNLMENDKIVFLIYLFQHLLSAEILSEWKIEFILPYLEKFSNQCKEQTDNKSAF